MSSSRRDSGPVVVGGEPRIDFLPIETKMRKENRRKRRSYVALVIMVAAACGIGIYFSFSYARQSQELLEAEQERTRELLSEQADYSEVLTVTADANTVRSARLVGTATEIMMKDFIANLLATLPELPDSPEYGATSISIDSISTLESPPAAASEFETAGITVVFLTVRVPDLATADAVLANLPRIPGYGAAIATSVTLEEGIYTTEITLLLTEEAFERRFFGTDGSADSGEDSDSGADSESDTESDPESDPEADPDSDSGSDSEGEDG